MFGLGGGELVLVILLAIILIGPKDIPKVASQVGRIFAQFKGAANDLKTTVERELDLQNENPPSDKKSQE